MAVLQDKNPNNREVAEKKFKQISEAYDVSSRLVDGSLTCSHERRYHAEMAAHGLDKLAKHAMRRYYQTQRRGKYMMHTAKTV